VLLTPPEGVHFVKRANEIQKYKACFIKSTGMETTVTETIARGADIQVSDLIVLLSGLSSAVILRPQRERYVLIGR